MKSTMVLGSGAELALRASLSCKTPQGPRIPWLPLSPQLLLLLVRSRGGTSLIENERTLPAWPLEF